MSPRLRQNLLPRLLLGATLSLLAATPLSPAYAQVITATIHGTVTDASGAVVPNATVTVLNTSTGVHSTATTDSKGSYSVPALQIGGPYTITISASGFSNYESRGLNLNVNDDRAVDGKLQVGGEAQTVQVEAQASQVETTETQLKTDIGAREITDLPILGRDASQLEKTAPGVVESSDRFGSFSANGSQTSQSSFMLDGADVNDVALQDGGIAVNPDALSEEAIVTSTLNPEYSRNSGAVVNQTLKTGTNSLHGNAFEFYRDTFLNNPNYFSLTRPVFHQNLYGGTIGGPILRDKLFFFLAYQGYRNRTGTTQQTPVFSSAQLGGDFSGDGIALSSSPMPFAVGGCAAGTPWNACPTLAGGHIPAASFSPLSTSLVHKYVPLPNNVSGGANLYNFNTTNSGAQDQGVIRIDYHPTQNDTLWGSSIFQSSPDTATLPFLGSTLPGFGEVDAQHIKVFNGDYTHTFSSTMLNELRAGYFRFNYASVTPQTVLPPSSLGFNIAPQDALASAPFISITGYASLGFSPDGPQPRKDTNLLGSDIFTKILGSHSLKFGVTYEQFGVDNPFLADNNGSYTFAGSGTYSSGDPAIDFLLGIPDQFHQTSGSLIDAISHEYYAFAQDSWKVSTNLAINYGISWDAETPWANHQFAGEGITCWQNSLATSKIHPQGPPGLLYPGDPGCSTYGAATVKWDHLGPRIGFDYAPGATHSLAIRGGFGLYYNRDQEEEALQNLSSPPYLLSSYGAADFGGSPAFANPFADVSGAGSEANKFPYTRPGVGAPLNNIAYANQDISNVDAKYNVPYSYNFNVNVQKELPGRMIAQVGYVGSLGRRLPRVTEADPITQAGHDACAANPACVAKSATIHANFPQYTAQPATFPGTSQPWYLSVGDQVSNGASSYHSLQASLTKQTSHGLYFTLAYTYSHSLDNDSGYESASGTGSPNGVGGYNGRSINFTPGFEYLNYGDSDYDARHRFVALYNYQVPLLARMRDNKLINEAIGGWHVSGTTTLQTGFPVTINQPGAWNSLYCDAYTYYGCADAPNTSSFKVKTLNARNNAAGNVWFDTSTFSSQPTGTFGNTPRNYFHGPGFNYTNMELFKNFPLGRADSPRVLQLRLESYNVFNHPNFAQPDASFSDTQTFGHITSVIQPNQFGGQATDPQPSRATQLSAKFSF